MSRFHCYFWYILLVILLYFYSTLYWSNLYDYGISYFTTSVKDPSTSLTTGCERVERQRVGGRVPPWGVSADTLNDHSEGEPD